MDGVPWEVDFDMIWDPVFSPDGNIIVAKGEKNGKFFLIKDGKIGRNEFEALWDPVFSPDGNKLLVRVIEDGKYYRRVIPVEEV